MVGVSLVCIVALRRAVGVLVGLWVCILDSIGLSELYTM